MLGCYITFYFLLNDYRNRFNWWFFARPKHSSRVDEESKTYWARTIYLFIHNHRPMLVAQNKNKIKQFDKKNDNQ